MAEYQKSPAPASNEALTVPHQQSGQQYQQQPEVMYAPTIQSQSTTIAANSNLPPSFIEKVEPRPEIDNGPSKGMIETVHQPAMVTPLNALDETSAWVDCPFCQRRTQTRVEHTDSGATTIAGVVCCLICICLACVPCLAGWFQNTAHYCSQCNKKLTYRPHDGSVTVMTPQANAQVPSQFAIASQPQSQPQRMTTQPQSPAQQQQQQTQQMQQTSGVVSQSPPAYPDGPK